MAMTTEQVLKVSTLDAVKNVTDLKNNISELKRVINGWTETTEEDGKKVVKTFEGLSIGSKEYQQAIKQLNENQAALRNAMHGTAASLEEVREAAKGASKEEIELDATTGKLVTDNDAALQSYNGLVKTLANLKEEWRATTDATERAALGEKINAVNNQLKELDASVGVYGRNVGSYQNIVDQLGNSLKNLGTFAPNVSRGLGGITTGLKALSATPAIAILGLLARILEEVIKALKSSEEGVESVTAVFGAFSGIGDTVTAILQKVAEGAGWLARQFVNLLEKLNLVNDKMKEKQAIAKEEIRIAREQRDATMKNADAERDIAELRAKSVDKLKYSTQERIKFLEEANAKEAEIADRARKAAKDEYELIKRRNALTKSSAEDMKAEADAYAKMVAADTNYQKKIRENISQITAARQEAASEAKQRQKEQQDAARARLDAEKEMLNLELSLLEEGTQERLNKQKEIAEKEYEITINSARAKITNQEELNKQLELLEKIHNAELEKMDLEFAEAQAQKVAEAQAREIADQEARKQARLEFQDWEREQEALGQENRLTLVQENQFQEMENEVALREWQLEKVREYGQLEGETEAEFRARELAAEKAFYDAKKKQRDGWLNTMVSAAGAVSGILGSIADMYESNTEMTEAEAKKAKNLRIASATIDMLQGAVTAYAGAQSLGVPMGPIIGAINAAAVVAAGIANISKIKATDINKDSGGGSASATIPAAVAAPSVVPQVQETRTITSASEEDRLNQMASEHRVYILSSDLEADREQSRARVAETTF